MLNPLITSRTSYWHKLRDLCVSDQKVSFTCEVEFFWEVCLEEGTAMIVYGDIAQPPALLPDS